jgi:hypothetical protein
MKNKYFVLICILTFNLFNSACIKIKDKEDGQDKSKAQSDSPQKLSEDQGPISYGIVSSQLPNQFKIAFQWDPNLNPTAVKKSKGDHEEIIALPDGPLWEDKISKDDSNLLKYDFGFIHLGEWQSIQEFQIPKPTDLIIENTVTWSQVKSEFEAEPEGFFKLKTHYRLFLKENSVLVTQGQNLKIRLSALHPSTGAKVITWPQGQVAQAQQAGRGGGFLELQTETLEGNLEIVLRGERGGVGATGQADPSLNGPAGRNGLDHEYRPAQINGFGAQVIDPICVRPPTDGEVGGPGQPGRSGGVGYRGGSSGAAHVQVSHQSESRINYTFEPGEGGIGGAGGPGGLGGPGGKAGNSLIKNTFGTLQSGPCAIAREGASGQEGPRGSEGPMGEAGLKQSATSLINGQTINY